MRETLDKVESREWIVLENCGKQIFGVLHRPLSFENPPIVVILHGFASSKHGSNRCYVTLAEKLAKEGIASLRFDFRGSGDSEGTLSEITFEDLVSDAAVVVKNIDTIKGIDSTRLAFFGASLGGSIAILTALNSKNIKALVLWAPVASGELWYHDFLVRHPEHLPADPGKILMKYEGVKLNPQFREQFACMRAFKAMQQLDFLPILHMQGEKDTTISIKHQEAFQQSCGHQPNVRFITYPDGEHSLGFSPHFPSVIDETVSWFQLYL